MNYQEQVEQMTNEEILQSIYADAGGDDYDGCFTLRGMVQFGILTAEFESRLLKCGFLNG